MIVQTLTLDQIDPPTQAHRLSMNEAKLWELADSIRDIGLIYPIVVRPTAPEHYEVKAGHRRYVAHRMLGRTVIDCIVRDASDADLEVLTFTENLQRDDLSPMEEAIAITRLAETTQTDAPAIAQKLRRSEAWVRGRMELMNLPNELQKLVHEKTLAVSTATALARVTDDAHRAYLLDYALRSGASASVIRSWVSEWEIAAATGTGDSAPKPIVGGLTQEIIIQIPCYTCHQPTDHREMAIVRLCRECEKTISEQSGGR